MSVLACCSVPSLQEIGSGSTSSKFAPGTVRQATACSFACLSTLPAHRQLEAGRPHATIDANSPLSFQGSRTSAGQTPRAGFPIVEGSAAVAVVTHSLSSTTWHTRHSSGPCCSSSIGHEQPICWRYCCRMHQPAASSASPAPQKPHGFCQL